MVHRCIVIVAGLSMRITVLLTLCVALLAVGTVQVRAGDTSDVLLLDVVLRPSGMADVIKTPMVDVQFIPGTHSVTLPMVISTEHYSATNRAFELEALRLINVERVNAGVAPLTQSAVLTQAARRHASDLAAHDILSHVGTDGSTVWIAGVMLGIRRHGVRPHAALTHQVHLSILSVMSFWRVHRTAQSYLIQQLQQSVPGMPFVLKIASILYALSS